MESENGVQKKREVLNNSFDELIQTFNRVEKMDLLTEDDRESIAYLKKSIVEKKNELNGAEGYIRIKNNQLDQFANYVQQDLEQADDTITLSVTVALLIVIILLLL